MGWTCIGPKGGSGSMSMQRAKVISNASWWKRGFLWNCNNLQMPRKGIVGPVVRWKDGHSAWLDSNMQSRSSSLYGHMENHYDRNHHLIYLDHLISTKLTLFFLLYHAPLMSSFLWLLVLHLLAIFFEKLCLLHSKLLEEHWFSFPVWKVPTSHMFSTRN